jgi:hypothetical protein
MAPPGPTLTGGLGGRCRVCRSVGRWVGGSVARWHGGPVNGPGGMTAREAGAGRADVPEGPNSRIPAVTATRAASEAE